MGIVEIENRKILLLKVRAMTGKEYYLVLLHTPKPGWMIKRDMEESMAEIWKDPDLLTAKKCNELEGGRFQVFQVPPHIRGEKKGKPKWEKLLFHKAFESLRDAIGYLEAEVGIHVLKIIESEPDVLRGADNKGTPDKT